MAENNERSEYFEDRAGTDEARFHVVPHGESQWAVKTEGEDEPNSTFGSKSEAVDEAKKMAEEAGTMAIVHNDDGQIEKQHHYQSE